MRRILAIALACASLFAGEAAAPPPAPPVQPESGPGGREYPHAAVRASRHGEKNDAYWLFEPADPAPEGRVPVVVFLHGWGAMAPEVYGAWIRHLVRRGNVVIHARYQESFLTPPAEFTPGLLAAVKAALARLETEEGRVRPARERCAVLGHSFGGALCFNYAALAKEQGLPPPRAILAMEPGTGSERRALLPFAYADLSKIDPATLLLLVTGEEDSMVGEATARLLWERVRSVPAGNRGFLRARSDRRGKPPLVADHLFPCAADGAIAGGDAKAWEGVRGGRIGIDALDTHVGWRLFDALMQAAFTGEGKELCLGGTEAQLDCGRWSDGTPVRTLEVVGR
ncbi:MAG: alpha/beta fold hydrolase [Planctomycetaceae bacterium]